MEQEQDVDFFLSTIVDNNYSSSTSANHHHEQHLRPESRATRQASTQPSSFLGVRKPPAKPWKKPGADPPVPPKVYRVEPRGFRQLVQKLTGAAPSSSIPDRQQPINNSTPPPFSTTPALHQQPIPPAPSSSSLTACARTFRDAAPSPLELRDQHQHQHQPQQQTMVAPYEEDQFSPFQWSSLLTPFSGGGQQSPSLFSAYLAWASNAVASPTGAMAPVEKKCSTPLVN